MSERKKVLVEARRADAPETEHWSSVTLTPSGGPMLVPAASVHEIDLRALARDLDCSVDEIPAAVEELQERVGRIEAACEEAGVECSPGGIKDLVDTPPGYTPLLAKVCRQRDEARAEADWLSKDLRDAVREKNEAVNESQRYVREREEARAEAHRQRERAEKAEADRAGAFDRGRSYASAEAHAQVADEIARLVNERDHLRDRAKKAEAELGVVKEDPARRAAIDDALSAADRWADEIQRLRAEVRELWNYLDHNYREQYAEDLGNCVPLDIAHGLRRERESSDPPDPDPADAPDYEWVPGYPGLEPWAGWRGVCPHGGGLSPRMCVRCIAHEACRQLVRAKRRATDPEAAIDLVRSRGYTVTADDPQVSAYYDARTCVCGHDASEHVCRSDEPHFDAGTPVCECNGFDNGVEHPNKPDPEPRFEVGEEDEEPEILPDEGCEKCRYLAHHLVEAWRTTSTMRAYIRKRVLESTGFELPDDLRRVPAGDDDG